MRCAIVTCQELPEPDVDEHLLVGALARHGVEVSVVAWDDPSVDWGQWPVAVIRSTWNYHRDRERFECWARSTAATTMLLNGLASISWNIDKRYLKDLEAIGVPVVPTAFVQQGCGGRLSSIIAERGWTDVVVKPTVSAGSRDTHRLMDPTGERAIFEALCERHDMMVQAYVADVDRRGERCHVWIDGSFTHTIRKQPRFSGSDERVSTGDVGSASDEREIVAAAVRFALDRDPRMLYARVDTVRDEHSAVMVMELEVLEPSLFLAQCPTACDRLVHAIADRVAGINVEDAQ